MSIGEQRRTGRGPAALEVFTRRAATARLVIAADSELLRHARRLDETVAGTHVDTRRFALGYAEANPYCHVIQDDGIHIRITPYRAMPSRRCPPTRSSAAGRTGGTHLGRPRRLAVLQRRLRRAPRPAR
ncbi:hypothetical protein ACWEV4_12330 [Streptomyces sp. NPDC003860]